MHTCLMLDVDGVLINGRPQDGRLWAHGLQDDLDIDPMALQTLLFRPHWNTIVTGRKALADVLRLSMPQLSATVSAEAAGILASQ
ncbi:MAG: hypothetical protein AB7E29_00830 [Xanthobacter sp.]